MNFQDLHELLRLELLRRIEEGSLNGARLARQAGFRQAHISNFLNRKRALSLDGLDRVLASQDLTLDRLLAESPLLASPSPLLDLAAAAVPNPDSADVIPVVSPSTAMDDPTVSPAAVIETVHVASSRLHDSRVQPASKYAHWQRFLAIRADAHQAAAMEPLLSPGSLIVLDRHYQSLAPYRAHQRTLYAVRCGAALALRFVEFDDGRLILRPLSQDFPIMLLPLASHQTPADYLVGRVCLVLSEL